MNLSKKKKLASRTFNVGEKRIVFLESRKDEIKEAITKQDMRDLKSDGAIIIKGMKGRKRNANRSRKRGVGKVRRKVNKRKREYVTLVRKLRKHVSGMKAQEKISGEEHKEIRKKIRNKVFRNKAHLKAQLVQEKK